MTTTLKLDQQLIPHDATGVGLTSAFIRRGNKKFSLQSTVAAKDTDDIFVKMVNNTQQGISIVVNSGAQAQMTITVPAVNLKTTKMGFDGDMTIWNIEVDETTCYQAAGVPRSPLPSPTAWPRTSRPPKLFLPGGEGRPRRLFSEHKRALAMNICHSHPDVELDKQIISGGKWIPICRECERERQLRLSVYFSVRPTVSLDKTWNNSI